MIPKLTAEQRDALRSLPGPVPVHDEVSQETYYIVDAATAKAARKQEDLAAILEGFADIQAGRISTLDDAFDRICRQLKLPAEQSWRAESP